MSARVLVVEDNPDNMKLMLWVLEDEDYEVETAETAEEGLAKLDQQPFDIVLMDISLPGMDGKEATRQLRKDPRFADLPILAVTAHAVKGETEAILASGVTGMVTKPIDEELLVQQIRQCLGQEPAHV